MGSMRKEAKWGVIFMTLLVFLDMQPFFVWSSVSPLGYRLYTGLILVTTLFLIYRVLGRKQIFAGSAPTITDCTRVPMSLVLVSSLVVLLFFYEVFLSGVVTETQQPFNLAMLCIHLGLMFFVLQDNFSLQKVFLNVKTIFAVSLIPAILVFFLIQLGLDLPAFSLSAGEGVTGEWRSYDLFFGTAVMIRQHGSVFINRLCGMFMEPGFVGTVGALFLFGDRFTLKDWRNVVIVVASLCTFSLAFVLLVVLGIVLQQIGSFKKRSHMLTSIILVLVILVGYFLFMSLPLEEGSMLGELQGRLEITEDGLAGDNRFGSSKWAEEAYEEFTKSDLSTRLFGYGQDLRFIPGTKVNIWMGVHSYKEFIFYFGIVGFALMLASLICTYRVKFKKAPKSVRWQMFVLLIVFLISIYQRYSVCNFYYFCILFGGGANLALSGVEGTKRSGSGKKRVIS